MSNTLTHIGDRNRTLDGLPPLQRGQVEEANLDFEHAKDTHSFQELPPEDLVRKIARLSVKRAEEMMQETPVRDIEDLLRCTRIVAREIALRVSLATDGLSEQDLLDMHNDSQPVSTEKEKVSATMISRCIGFVRELVRTVWSIQIRHEEKAMLQSDNPMNPTCEEISRNVLDDYITYAAALVRKLWADGKSIESKISDEIDADGVLSQRSPELANTPIFLEVQQKTEHLVQVEIEQSDPALARLHHLNFVAKTDRGQKRPFDLDRYDRMRRSVIEIGSEHLPQIGRIYDHFLMGPGPLVLTFLGKFKQARELANAEGGRMINPWTLGPEAAEFVRVHMPDYVTPQEQMRRMLSGEDIKAGELLALAIVNEQGEFDALGIFPLPSKDPLRRAKRGEALRQTYKDSQFDERHVGIREEAENTAEVYLILSKYPGGGPILCFEMMRIAAERKIPISYITAEHYSDLRVFENPLHAKVARRYPRSENPNPESGKFFNDVECGPIYKRVDPMFAPRLLDIPGRKRKVYVVEIDWLGRGAEYHLFRHKMNGKRHELDMKAAVAREIRKQQSHGAGSPDAQTAAILDAMAMGGVDLPHTPQQEGT